MKRYLAQSIWFLAFCLFTVYHLLFTGIIHAQGTKDSQFSLGVYPPILEINVKPPSGVEADFQIQNLTDLPQDLALIFKSFRPSDFHDGIIRHINEGLNPLILKNVKIYDGDIPVEQLLLEPYESRNLKLKITLDKDPPLGDYYFSVIFLSSLNQSRDTSSSRIDSGIGINVILSLGEKGVARGEIKEFSTPHFLDRGPVPITLLLQNNSNHYVLPQGRIIIRDVLGREAGELNILPQYILSNSSRYIIDSDQASQSAAISQDHPVLLWNKKFLFGLYSANAKIKFSTLGPVFETTVYFFAIPIYLVFFVSFLSFVLLGIYYRTKKRL